MRLSIRWKLIFSIVGPVIIISMLVIWLTVGKIYQYSIDRLNEQVVESARNYTARLDAQFQILEQVARDTAAVLEKVTPLDGETMYELLRSNVERNPLIFGAAIAFAPYKYDVNRRLFSPYVYRSGPVLNAINIGTQSYDYTEEKWEWFVRARESGKPIWTEPYFDEGAGNILMNTFSVPFYRASEFLGVTTVDIALDELQQQVGARHLMNLPFIIVSPSGRFITHPNKKMIMRETIQHRAEVSGDPALQTLAREMLDGRTGVIRVDRLAILKDEPYWIFYAPIQSTGWSFVSAVPEREMLAFAHLQIGRGITGVIILLGLIIICIHFASTRITRPLSELADAVSQLGSGNFTVKVKNNRPGDEVGDLARAFNNMIGQLNQHINALAREVVNREAVESELRIARQLQASLLPNKFPPFPDRKEFDLFAVNAAARQVGGDFFDYFFVDDTRLVLVVADVSGKGTPAAIVMAVTRTIIRNLARTVESPARLLIETNRLLLETDISQIFVTMFIAVYQPANGRIVYANAGHQPPYLLNADGAIGKLGQATGTIVGMLEDAHYEECVSELLAGDYLIAYTDGIPDARSPHGQFYGEPNFTSLLSSCAGMTANEICNIIISELIAFQAKNLADDITLLVLRRNY